MSHSVDATTALPGAAAAPVVFVGGFWRRLGAGVVDGVCLAPALLLLCWLAWRVGGVNLPAQLRFESLLELFLEGGGLVYSLFAVVVIITLVYGFLFTVTTGATPGLKLLGLRVINLYGDPPQWWRALLRGGGLLLGAGLLGLGLLWVGFDREKRGLHDWLAGTYVIRASRSD